MPADRTPEQLLTLIVERAGALIAAGVTSLSIDGLAVTLVKPPPVSGPADKPARIARQHIDPLQDASTYPGGKVPGFSRDEDKQ